MPVSCHVSRLVRSSVIRDRNLLILEIKKKGEVNCKNVSETPVGHGQFTKVVNLLSGEGVDGEKRVQAYR